MYTRRACRQVRAPANEHRTNQITARRSRLIYRIQRLEYSANRATKQRTSLLAPRNASPSEYRVWLFPDLNGPISASGKQHLRRQLCDLHVQHSVVVARTGRDQPFLLHRWRRCGKNRKIGTIVKATAPRDTTSFDVGCFRSWILSYHCSRPSTSTISILYVDEPTGYSLS